MIIKTYRIYISGKVSPRHSQYILHKMLEDMNLAVDGQEINDKTPNIRNMHRGDEEAYFDIDIPETEGVDTRDIVERIKQYIVDNSTQYEDITDSPPKKLFDVT